MKRLLTIAALLTFALAASAALAASPAGKDKDPPSAAEAKAVKACKTERGTTAATITAFEMHGTNKNKKNAFGKCVSSKTKDDKDDEDEADENKNKTNASKKCKAERGTTAATITAFEMHGTNKNKRNAHGKCVSKHAKRKS